MLTLLAMLMRGPGTSYVGNRAASLDGVDEYLVGPSQTINTTAVAVSCWFLADNTTGEKVLCHHRLGGTQYFSLYLNGATVNSDARRTSSVFTATTAAVVTAGQWHHAVACLDDAGGGTGRLRVWVDGVLEATRTGAIAHGSITGGVAYGRVQQSFLWYLNGKIADIFWWDVSLSDADVAAMWNGGSRCDPEAASGLTAARGFPFAATDDMTGTTGSVADIKGGSPLVPTNTESGDLVAGPA